MKHNFLDRLHGLKLDSACSEKWSACLSKLNSSIKVIDTNFWESSKPAATIELLNNVLKNEYQNGFNIDFGDTFSISDNIALATHFAIEIEGLKRFVLCNLSIEMFIKKTLNFRVLILDFDKKNPHKLENNWNGKVLYMSLDHERTNDSSSKSTQRNTSKLDFENDGPFTVNIPLNKVSRFVQKKKKYFKVNETLSR